jgi:hypothetical protein
MLTEIEEIGIKIVVLLRKKMLSGYSCSDCTDEMKATRNCNGDADHSVPVFYNPHIGQSYVCPMRLIPKSVYSFIDQYDYYEKYPASAPSYENVNPRYWDAVRLYEQFTYEVDKVEDKPQQKDTTENNLSRMKSLMKSRKPDG